MPQPESFSMNVPQPLVSVIIPVAKGARYVGQAIGSVLAQTWPSREIFVIDHGADDETRAIVRSFGDALRSFSIGKSVVARARNRGLAEARGDAVAFLDANDLWLPEKLRLQMQVYQGSGEPGLLFGMVECLRATEPGSGVRDGTEELTGPRPGILPSTLLASQKVFERVGRFNERWPVGEFIEWYARCLDAGCPVQVMPEVVAQRRMSPHIVDQLTPRLTHSA